MQLNTAERLGPRFLNPVPTKIGGFSTIFKMLPRVLSDRAARSPRTPPGPFHTDPRIYRTPPDAGLRVTWFGHSASLIEIDGVTILVDPVWDERAAPVQWSGPKRFFPPTIALDDLPPIDAIIISHDHYDHLGAGTIERLAQMKSLQAMRWITPLGVAAILEGLGVAPAQCTELDWTETTHVGSVGITALPTRHFSGRSLFNRFRTLWAAFALIGPVHRVFYGSDSGEWDGFRDIGRRFGPFDLTMLEIGASDRLWSDIHLGPDGAVRSFRAIGGEGMLMPIHWGLFNLAFHPWRQPIEVISKVEGLRLWSPTPGEPTEVVAGVEVRSDWWRDGSL